ncbi:hypothetical protein JOD55_000388 [Arcanobacterium pluranimalium]|uniref:hypothetical protein n=1 Tax=Arcanobacterium pluranimalium TaxID=108028 RepID=UPI001959B296|nr:hypothetical protein [Arcanobacterium pluranimalium]MBM7824561.1 hypothetical protein [Arcanobacterium pluranimalium]
MRLLLGVAVFFLLITQFWLGALVKAQAVGGALPMVGDATLAADSRIPRVDSTVPLAGRTASAVNSTTPATGRNAENVSPKPVVVILTDSLNWDYINTQNTPALAQWAAAGTMFNVIPPSLSDWTCPIDVAVAMGAGGQVAKTSVSRRPTCIEPSVFYGSEFLNWGSIAIRAAEESPHLTLGSFGEILEQHQVDFAAIGNQAAYIAANRHGKAPNNYHEAALGNELFAKQVRDSSLTKQLTIVDASISNFALDPDRQSAANEKSLFITRLPLNDPETRAGADFLPALIYRDIQAKNNAQRVEALMKQLDPGTLVVFASLQGLGSTESMQAGFISAGNSKVARNTVAWSAQVRQTGNITYASLLPTVLEHLKNAGVIAGGGTRETTGGTTEDSAGGIGASSSAPQLPGTAIQNVPLGDLSSCAADSCFEMRRSSLADMALQAAEIRKVRGGFYVQMTWSAIVFIAASCGLLFGVFRGAGAGAGAGAGNASTGVGNASAGAGERRKIYSSNFARVLRKTSYSLSARLRKPWVATILGVMGLTISSVPVASHFVTMTYGWWRASDPQFAIITSTWLLALVIATGTFFLFRFHILLPLVVIGSTTGIALVIDTATGAKVMSDAPMGFNTLLGARFYGLGNEPFALLSTGILIFAGFLAHCLIRRGWKRIFAALASAVVPLVAAAIGVWPTMGADFGGALAFVPAIALFVLLVGRIIPSWKKIGLLSLAAIVVAFGTATIDWLRPVQSRTHLGNFVQSILDGEASEIIARKIAVNLRLLVTSSHRWVALAGVVLIVVVIIPAARKLYGKLMESVEVCTLIAVGTCLTIAFLVNDSGIVIPGMGFILLLPALAAGLFQIPRHEQARHEHPEPVQKGKSAQSLA